MFKALQGVAALALVIGVITVAQLAMGDMQNTNTAESAQLSRACMFPTGGWTAVDCSNVAAASSAVLTAWTRYVVQCTDDSYVAFDDAATGGLADANDGYLPNGAWLEFMTTDTVKYYSCLNLNSDADCRHIECQ